MDMPSSLPAPLLKLEYARAATEYLKRLPPEHFMESTKQADQREITLASFRLVTTDWPDFQFFNELLVQTRKRRSRGLVQVVPDNMVVLHPEKIRADGSYDVEIQPAGPFWVLEYISKSNPRKDYEDSYRKYEKDLKVPYYLLFYPDEQELTLFHRGRARYVSVKPNTQGRLALPEAEMEVAILDGWVRYWFRGRLLPLPADLLRSLNEANRRAEVEARRAEAAEAEVARLRAELERVRGGKPG
jgi:Uma2 family endonuclease